MNDKTHNFLFGLAMVLLLISFIISMAILSTNQEEERAKVCKRIGVKANLEYYDVGKKIVIQQDFLHQRIKQRIS